MRRGLYSLLFISWLGVIFFFSSQNATTSLSLSDQVVEKLITISHKKIDPKQKQKIIKKSRVIVRKTAHFVEFLILGSILVMLFNNGKIKNATTLSILLCFLCSCSDEFHQIFSAGRTPRLLDILVDTAGGVTGILFFNKIGKKKIAKKAKIGYNIAEEKGKCAYEKDK